MSASSGEVFQKLNECLNLRRKRVLATRPGSRDLGAVIKLDFGHDGIMRVADDLGKCFFEVPSLSEFYSDSETLFRIRTTGPVASHCHQRLRLMQTRFELYAMLCGDREQEEVAQIGGRDFYNVRKVDTHVHHSAAMNAKHLLRFMKKKLKSHSDDVVEKGPDGKEATLGQVFQRHGIKWENLSLDRLQVWADKSCKHRFDRFNNKYSPMGQNELRNIFLKTDNALGGRYLAELTRELLDDLEESKYQHAEWRLSIYGRKRDEWLNLSHWVLGRNGRGDGKALLSPNLRWMIQFPRLYSLYKGMGQIQNFREMLENIFAPIFEATLEPEKHRDVADFLEQVSGFDTVDDESSSSGRTFSSKETVPGDWTFAENPSYRYYSFFIWANLQMLNKLRASKGMNQFSFRPHAGEAGEVHHLDTAFLLADGINHGINLRKSPALEYLFCLAQIGIAVSPCSNNQLFLSYEKSPFPTFFARGLNVSLSTDDPLMFHQTKEPLMEEYSIAKQLWHLTSVDLCEISRNSVLQSGFSEAEKAHWLGTTNYLEEVVVSSTNVPPLRRSFRRQQMGDEMKLLHGQTTLAEQETNIAEMLLLSPSNRMNMSHFLASPKLSIHTLPSPAPQDWSLADDRDESGCFREGADRPRETPLAEDGIGVDSDLLGADGEENDAWRSPCSPFPLSPLLDSTDKFSVSVPLKQGLRCLLPDSAVQKREATPDNSQDEVGGSGSARKRRRPEAPQEGLQA